MVKPSYYLCGAGSELNCPHWDDINGCWRDCKEAFDENCDPPNIEEEEEDYDT